MDANNATRTRPQLCEEVSPIKTEPQEVARAEGDTKELQSVPWGVPDSRPGDELHVFSISTPEEEARSTESQAKQQKTPPSRDQTAATDVATTAVARTSQAPSQPPSSPTLSPAVAMKLHQETTTVTGQTAPKQPPQKPPRWRPEKPHHRL